MLEFLATLVLNGTKTSSTLKMVHYNACAKAIQEKFGIVRTGDHVKNHLKTWQKKFRKICDLRGLSAANWDEDTCTITLDEEHYNNHIKVWMLSTSTLSLDNPILLAANCCHIL
jgi:4-aminobutyrate aminotransferase-like enzyme